MSMVSNKNNNALLRVGNDIASLWGASCYDYTIDFDAKKVVFHCVEDGEFFVTDATFDEIKTDYSVDVETEYKIKGLCNKSLLYASFNVDKSADEMERE